MLSAGLFHLWYYGAGINLPPGQEMGTIKTLIGSVGHIVSGKAKCSSMKW